MISALIMSLVAASSASAAWLEGAGPAFRESGAHAVSGDTLVREGRSYRLAGVRATGSPGFCYRGSETPRSYGCNGEARHFLNELLRDEPVRCVPVEVRNDGYRCFVGDKDLAAELVLSGNAVAVGPRGAAYDYAVQMLYAQQMVAGMWRLLPPIEIRPGAAPIIRTRPGEQRRE